MFMDSFESDHRAFKGLALGVLEIAIRLLNDNLLSNMKIESYHKHRTTSIQFKVAMTVI